MTLALLMALLPCERQVGERSAAISYAFSAKERVVIVSDARAWSPPRAMKDALIAVSPKGDCLLAVERQEPGNPGYECAIDLVDLKSHRVRRIAVPLLTTKFRELFKAKLWAPKLHCTFGRAPNTALIWDSTHQLLYRVNLITGKATLILSSEDIKGWVPREKHANPETSNIVYDSERDRVFIAIAGDTSISPGEELTRYPVTLEVNLTTRRMRKLGPGMPVGILASGKLCTWQLDGMGSRAWILDQDGRKLAERRNIVGLSVHGDRVLCLGQRVAKALEPEPRVERRLEILDSKLKHHSWGPEIDPGFKWMLGATLIAVKL
ncbi:MAG: hypothetical protein ABL949_13165 [Fimbriimonadaceae bacterium]